MPYNTYFTSVRTISFCLITHFNTHPSAVIQKHYEGVSLDCECTVSFGKSVQSRAQVWTFRKNIFASVFNKQDSTDPELPPLQFQLFTFPRALCIKRHDWLWFLPQNSERLTSLCDIFKNVKAGQSACCQMTAANYLGTNRTQCRCACRLATVFFLIPNVWYL